MSDFDDLDTSSLKIVGDGQLISKEKFYPDYTKNFMNLVNYWKKVDNIHALVPRYLKDNEAYHL